MLLQRQNYIQLHKYITTHALNKYIPNILTIINNARFKVQQHYSQSVTDFVTFFYFPGTSYQNYAIISIMDLCLDR